MEKNNVLIDTVQVERIYSSSGKGSGVFDTRTQNVCIDLQALKRFLHRRKQYVLFADEDGIRNKETWYWAEFSIFIDDNYDKSSTEMNGTISSWNGSIYSIGTDKSKPIQKFKLMSFISNDKQYNSDVDLILEKDQRGKLYFLCDDKKVENLKVWLENPGGTVLERCADNKKGENEKGETVKSDNYDVLALGKCERVEFSLQNVTQNIKQLNSSFDKKNSDEFTIYYFVETEDSNGKYEFDSCETISLSKDKIGDEDAKFGYISVHDGKPVETKKIKMFIKEGPHSNCREFGFHAKGKTTDYNIEVLKKHGFVELDVKRGTDKENDRYCVMCGENRVDQDKITELTYTNMWFDGNPDKINFGNKGEFDNDSKVEISTPVSFSEINDNKLKTPTLDHFGKDEKEKIEEVFVYTGTNEDSERERQAIKNYLDKGFDSEIRYANPNVVKDLNDKNYGISHLEKKNCIIINVSELCNSLVYRYKNNDKNLWFFQRWYAKFTLFFNIGKFAKIFNWYPTKHSYESNPYTKQIKSGLDDNYNENNKIKNEDENGKEDENMAAPPGYTDNLL